VIRESGELSHYRWGTTRKAAMLGWEAARLNANVAGKARQAGAGL
jgi:AraC family transcriptional regulator of adaptative response/methylated-DNA-[protein]-cysteine methyltransferase